MPDHVGIDYGDHVTLDDVELLLCIGIDGTLVFMPDASMEDRLRHARWVCRALRMKPEGGR